MCSIPCVGSKLACGPTSPASAGNTTPSLGSGGGGGGGASINLPKSTNKVSCTALNKLQAQLQNLGTAMSTLLKTPKANVVATKAIKTAQPVSTSTAMVAVIFIGGLLLLIAWSKA